MSRRVFALATALVLATALDVMVAAGSGYNLRMEPLRLVALDAALLALLVVPTLGAVHATRWIPGFPGLTALVPRASVLFAAWAPILALRVGRVSSASELAPHLIVTAILALVVFLETRRGPGAPRRAEALVAIGAGLLAIACGLAVPLPGRWMLTEPPPGSASHATPAQPNLILIVVDTTRADHLGVYGYPRPTSPWLDYFAQQATVFEQALSSSSWTLPAHATLFTGLFPRSHGADLVEGDGGMSLAELGRLDDTARVRPLSPDAVTLAKLAAKAGMDTGAICANSAYLFRYFGLDQGFQTYVDPPGSRPSHRPVGLSLGIRLGMDRFWGFRRLIEGNERFYLLGSEVNRLALHWLDRRRDRRFFLFLNYMDAHEPHIPIGRYRWLFPASDGPPKVAERAIRDRQRAILPEEQQRLVDVYDVGVRSLDDHLHDLFDRLAAWDLLDRTVVLIVGDHGESLGEHNELGHANGVYSSEVRVPLLLRLPGQRDGKRVSRLVHMVDVFPTLVDLLGLENPGGLQGATLFGDGRPYPLVVYTGRYRYLAEHYPRYYDRTHYALYKDPWTLIRHSDGDVELYDIRADPAEERNVAGEHVREVTELTQELEGFEETVKPEFATPVTAAANEEAQRRLRALGYLQ
ncbi:MAG: DUF229 domain-containing protein [Chloroflexi bacterium]|nr:MAG: DUF229 domain-containing protein [Chloroflexota bacterium]